jgi:uncharacterized membrane protein
MKSNIGVLIAMAIYFVLSTIGYVVFSNIYWGYTEPIGTIVIGLLVILSVFIAYYLYAGDKRTALLPEDRLDAEISDDSGEVGFFSPWSWWPLILGASIAFVFLSLAVGWWLTYFAIPFAIVAVVGFVFEYSRGANAH